MLLADHGARGHQDRAAGRRPDALRSPARRCGTAASGARCSTSATRPTTPAPRAGGACRRRCVESYAPGTTAELGIDYDDAATRATRASCTARSPRYGDDGRHADRPGLRRARSRPAPATSGRAAACPAGPSPASPASRLRSPTSSCPTTAGWPRRARARCSPACRGSSVATCYLATLAISAALRVREQTGRGQRVSTSLLQGVLATTLSALAAGRARRAPTTSRAGSSTRARRRASSAAPTAAGSTTGSRSPTSCSAPPRATALQRTEKTTRAARRDDAHRHGRRTRCSCCTTTSRSWRRRSPSSPPNRGSRSRPRSACRCSRSGRPRRRCTTRRSSPTAASPRSIDPELGPVRQVGRVYELHACPTDGARPRRRRSAPTPTTVRAEADAVDAGRAPVDAVRRPRPASPLAGVRVLDLGLAVAGPWGTKMLADLGADVIKVNPLHDGYWMSTHIAMCCNRGKRSIAINLKDPDGDGDPARAGGERPTSCSTTCATTPRYASASTTRACARSSPTSSTATPAASSTASARALPGNDQTGAALAGPDWLDGGLDHDGIPIWPVVVARRHRQRLPVGHRHRAGARTTATAPARASSSTRRSCTRSCSTRRSRGARPTAAGHGERPQLDAMQTRLARVLPPLRDRRRLAVRRRGRPTSSAPRWPRRSGVGAARRGRRPRSTRSNPRSATRTAAQWFAALDAAGVPCEVSTPDFVLDLFDDPEMIEKGWVTQYRHPIVGEHGRHGPALRLLGDARASCRARPSCRVRTRAPSSRELGYDDDRIDKLAAAGTVLRLETHDVPGVIPPSPTLDDQFFWDAVADGHLVFQRCAACGTLRHPPAPMCGECHSVEWDTQESLGTRVTSTRGSSRTTRPSPTPSPRIVVLVELDEGIRFVSNLLGVDAGDVRNGMEVALSIEPVDDVVAPAVPAGGRPVSALARDTAIVGIGQTEFSKHSGRSELQLAGEAVAAAVADAGLTPADIDGAVTFAIDVERRAVGHPLRGDPGAAVHGRGPAAAAVGRAPRCSSPRPRSRRAPPTRWSCTARSTSARAGASASRSSRTTRRG